jgi:hypothetical protein
MSETIGSTHLAGHLLMAPIEEVRRKDLVRHMKLSQVEHLFDNPADELLVVLVISHGCHFVTPCCVYFEELRTL